MYGWNKNPASDRMLEKTKAAYAECQGGLDEVDCPAGAAKKWIWNSTARGVFVARGVEDNCMNEFVNFSANKTPDVIFYDWLDCNMETGFGEQNRRFGKALYATPSIDFKPLPYEDAKGIQAETGGKGDKKFLRLVNKTPYIMNGFIQTSASSLRDIVYDRDLKKGILNGKYEVEMKPYDIRIIEINGDMTALKCDFSMPEAAAEKIKKQVKYILSKEVFLQKVPGDMIAVLFRELERNDSAALYNTLKDFEVMSNVNLALAEQQAEENQEKLLKLLNEKGRASIICASTTEYKDRSGKLWLPDQKYTGGKAYGNKGANYADRGALKIENTNAERVYQTEAYGGYVTYKIPVPNGTYNVYLHFAETYEPINRPGCRAITVKVENYTHPQKIDPFAMAGGFAKPYILELKKVPVYDDAIDIELIATVGINGIEIEKAE